MDVTNTRSQQDIRDFFTTPPTPKRNPKHRNFKNRTDSILTAAERIQALRLAEISKEEALALRVKKSELREARKKEKDKKAEEIKLRKINREKAKEEKDKQKQENAEKRKIGSEKKKSNKIPRLI